MKQIIQIIICLLIVTSGFGQSREDRKALRKWKRKCDSASIHHYQNYPYILEGKEVADEYFVHDNNVYGVSYVLIAKVLRGEEYIRANTENNIIRIVQRLETVGLPVNTDTTWFYGDVYNQERTLYLLTNDSIVNFASNRLNLKSCALLKSNPYHRYYRYPNDKEWQTNGDDISERKLYRYIKKYGGGTISKTDDSIYIEKSKNYFRGIQGELKSRLYGTKLRTTDKVISQQKSSNYEYLTPKQFDSLLNSWIDKRKLDSLKRTNYIITPSRLKSGSDQELNYYIENPRIVIPPSTDSLFYSIDIVIASNIDRFSLRNTFRLKYPSGSGSTDRFFENSGATNKIKAILPKGSENYIVSMSDQATNIIGVAVGGKQTPLSQTTNQKRVLVTLQFYIKSIENTTTFSFVNFDFSNVLNIFGLTNTYDPLYSWSPNVPIEIQHDSSYYAYASVNLNNPSSFPMKLTPQIYSLNKTSYTAGIDTLIITGKNLGAKTQYSQIELVNADKPNNNISLDTIDYVKNNNTMVWNDTVIKFVLPSVEAIENAATKFCAGTGDLKITTAWGTSATKTITVDKAFKTVYLNKKKLPIYLIDKATRGGLRFRYGEGSSNLTTQQKTFIAQAFSVWASKFSIAIDLDTSTTSTAEHEITCISMGTGSETSAMETRTTASYSSALNVATNNNIECAYAEKHTIKINKDASFSYSGGANDFYSSILHEIGHVLLLNHLISEADLMYWQVTTARNVANNNQIDAQTIINTSKQLRWINPNIFTLTDKGACPAMPTNFLVSPTINPGELQLTWQNNSTNITFYNIELFNIYSGIGTRHIDGITTSYTATNLEQESKYSVKIQAANSICVSPWTTELDATTAFVSPPQDVYDFLASPNQLYIAWTGTTDVSYTISRSTDGKTFQPLASVAAGIFNYQDNIVEPNTSYTYRIVAQKNGYSSTIQQITLTTGNLSLCSSNATVKLQNMQTIPTQLYATQTIQAGASVDNTRAAGDVGVNNAGNVTLEAGQNVSFEPGFTVEASTNRSLLAQIKDCSTGVVAFKTGEQIGAELVTTTVIQQTTETEEIRKQSFAWAMYPNPANNNITISCSNSMSQIEIVNLWGQIVLKQLLVGSVSEIDISNLAGGIYMVKCISDQGVQQQQQLVKQ